MKAITFAIIGCGKIGVRHAAHISARGALLAVCDVIEEKAKALAIQHNCDYYTSIYDLLNSNLEIDVIAVCTPNGLHAQQTIACLEDGHHVVCEKPMAIRVEDCRRMILTSEQYERHLFIVKQNRFNKAVAAVKEALDKNALGNILSFQLSCFWNRNNEYYTNSWHGSKDLDGGTLFTQFSHFIDILYWFLGDVQQASSYLCNAAHQGITALEDTGTVLLQMHNGAVGTLNYTVNSYNQNMEGSLTLFGTKGTVKIGGQYLNNINYQNIHNYTIPFVSEQSSPNDYGTYKGSMSNHNRIYDNVLDVLQHNASISTSAYEGLKTVEIIQKIYAANILSLPV